MNCEADLLHLPIIDALAEVNKCLYIAALADNGNQSGTVEVFIRDYVACATTPYTFPNGSTGESSILAVIMANNILTCMGRNVEFKAMPVNNCSHDELKWGRKKEVIGGKEITVCGRCREEIQ